MFFGKAPLEGGAGCKPRAGRGEAGRDRAAYSEGRGGSAQPAHKVH